MFDRLWGLITGREGREAAIKDATNNAVQAALGRVVQSLDAGQLNIFGAGHSYKTIPAGKVASYFNRWPYAASTAIADAVSALDFSVQTKSGDVWADAPDHPLATVLARPNPHMSTRMMLRYLALDWYFLGEHYWHVRFNGMQEPAELWPLFGSVEPIPDPELFIRGYKQVSQTERGQKITYYEPDEVVRFVMPTFHDAINGASDLEAAASSVQVDDKIVEAQWRAFRQGIFSSGVLSMGEEDPQLRKELLGEFNSAHRGAREAGNAIGIGTDMSWTPTSKTPREMDFSASATHVRDEITGVSRVPDIAMGITRDVQNRATAEASEYVFAKWNILPKAKMIEDQLRNDMARRYYGDDVRVVVASPVPADAESQRADDKLALEQRIQSVNEIRAQRGLDDVPWGDEPLVQANLIPISDAGKAAAGAGSQALAINQEVTPSGYSAAERREIMAKYESAQVPFLKQYTKTWVRIFRSIEEQFMPEFDKSQDRQDMPDGIVTQDADDAVVSVLNENTLANHMARETKGDNVRGLVIGGQTDGEIAGIPGRGSWSSKSSELMAAAAEFGPAHYAGIASTTRKQVEEVIARAIAKRKTWGEMRDMVEDSFSHMTAGRAGNIATTETTKLFNAGAQAFRSEFDVPFKQWIASYVNTRPTHAAADGQVRRNGDPYRVGQDSMQYPGGGMLAEENCNCNCYSVGVPTKAGT